MSTSRDYYEILGVERSADESTIKKAFRRLAMEYHPDRNPGKEASDKFREAQEAYSILSDAEKRSSYDQFGHAAFSNRGAGAEDIFSGFQSIFEDFFGGRSSAGNQRGADLLFRLEVSFREAVLGATKIIEINRQNSCEVCAGLGAEPGTHPETCPVCQGRGKISRSQGFFMVSQTCYQCSGYGKLIRNPCKNCRGQGHYSKRQQIEVQIPAGVDTGVRLRLSNEGELPERGTERGDLYVEIHVQQDEVFERDGNNLYIKIGIPYPVAVLGGEVQIPLLEGEKKLRLPPMTASHHREVLKHEGVKDLRQHKRGDLVVEFHIETPSQLSAKARDLIEQLQNEFQKSRPPERPSGAKKKNKKGFFDSFH